MAPKSNAPSIIQYSPGWDGNLQSPWRGGRDSFAFKICPVCGQELRPYQHKTGIHKGFLETESAFSLRVCCGKSCAKKLKNPMHSEETRKKMSDTFKRLGIQPKVKWGNGNGMTPPQALLLSLLGEGWEAEFTVNTNRTPKQGFPHAYKIDIANPSLMIAVEIDGSSHHSPKRREQDQKKDALLVSLGWKVLRLSNTQTESLCSTFGSEVTRRILRMAI